LAKKKELNFGKWSFVWKFVYVCVCACRVGIQCMCVGKYINYIHVYILDFFLALAS